jgi:hypothetical protein
VTGDAIKAAVIGKTVDLDTPLGTPITIVFKDNGTMSGSAGAALSIYLGAAADRGRWWVADGRLCQKFFKWLEGETSCLRIRQDGRRIFWTRDDGKRGTATITANGPVRPQPAYGLGGTDLVRQAQQKAPQPAPAVEPPAAIAAVPADRTPAIEPPSPRPVRAALTPAALPPTVRAIQPPDPVPIERAAPETDLSNDPAHAWPQDPSLAASGYSAQRAMVGAMVAETQKSHAQYRWCHEIRDFRLLTRPHAVDAEAPELLTAWRHMLAPETSGVPAASCIVPAPALVDVSRRFGDAR